MDAWAEMSTRLMAVVDDLDQRRPGCFKDMDVFSEDEGFDGVPVPAGAIAHIRIAPWHAGLEEQDGGYPELCLWLFEEGWKASIYNAEDESDIEVPMDFAVDTDPPVVVEYLVDVLEGRILLEP